MFAVKKKIKKSSKKIFFFLEKSHLFTKSQKIFFGSNRRLVFAPHISDLFSMILGLAPVAGKMFNGHINGFFEKQFILIGEEHLLFGRKRAKMSKT